MRCSPKTACLRLCGTILSLEMTCSSAASQRFDTFSETIRSLPASSRPFPREGIVSSPQLRLSCRQTSSLQSPLLQYPRPYSVTALHWITKKNPTSQSSTTLTATLLGCQVQRKIRPHSRQSSSRSRIEAQRCLMVFERVPRQVAIFGRSLPAPRLSFCSAVLRRSMHGGRCIDLPLIFSGGQSSVQMSRYLSV